MAIIAVRRLGHPAVRRRLHEQVRQRHRHAVGRIGGRRGGREPEQLRHHESHLRLERRRPDRSPSS